MTESNRAVSGQQFVGQDLRRATFRECDLSGAILRGVDITGAQIEAPWLIDDGGSLLVNGVDVAPLVDAELNRRFPGREKRHASTPAGLSAAWEPLAEAWEDVIGRVRAMPPGIVDRSVAGEWSFSQTVRHLVHAIDVWLNKAVLQSADPFHPLGQPCDDPRAVETPAPTTSATFDDVVAAWQDRAGAVRDFIARTSDTELAHLRPNPHDPRHEETVGHCVRTILQEGWEHLRYAARDLDALAGDDE